MSIRNRDGQEDAGGGMTDRSGHYAQEQNRVLLETGLYEKQAATAEGLPERVQYVAGRGEIGCNC